jgi:membrane-associated phospholipid phosphatase
MQIRFLSKSVNLSVAWALVALSATAAVGDDRPLPSAESLLATADAPTVSETSAGTDRSVVDEGENHGTFSQLGRDLSAPVRGRGLTILLTSAALAGVAFPFAKSSAADIGGDRPMGSHSSIGYELGLWHINLAYLVGSLGYGLIADDSEALRKSALMFRATAYTGLVTTGLKELQLEQRPRRDGDFKSFPSGHSSNAFAFAGSIYRNHGPVYGVPAMGMAVFVGLSRLSDNAHYMHDVIFGAGIGLSYAFGIDSSWSNKTGSRTVTALPVVGDGNYGLAAVVDF